MIKIFACLIIITCPQMINAQTTIFLEKNGTLSSSATGVDVDFNRSKTDITIPETGIYLVMLSAQGSGNAITGSPATCHHKESTVSVWSRTKQLELLKTPFDYTFGDNTGTNVGLKHLSFPYYNIAILSLDKNEVIGLKAMVTKYCPSNAALGNWDVYSAKIKIVKL